MIFPKLILQVGFALATLLVFLAATPQTANAQETGNFCVQDYLPGAGCTANDVRIERVRILNLIKPCNIAPNVGYMEAVFEVLISSAAPIGGGGGPSPNRYDIGFFMATDGGSALTGDSCYHDYLPPPLTAAPAYADFNSDTIPDIYDGPWWEGEAPRNTDDCGDIEQGTQLFRITQPITVACADSPSDPDNAADLHVCTSWDNNAGTACSAVQQAVPGTSSKCSCSTVNLPFTPSAIELAMLTARSRAAAGSLFLAGFGMLLVTGGGGLFWLQRKRIMG